jgi:hypothetical protein
MAHRTKVHFATDRHASSKCFVERPSRDSNLDKSRELEESLIDEAQLGRSDDATQRMIRIGTSARGSRGARQLGQGISSITVERDKVAANQLVRG